MKQQKLLNIKSINEFGGELNQNKRKSRRPLDSKRPLHLVLRADVTKIGSFLYQQKNIEKHTQKYAIKFGIKIYQKAIVKNHMHLIIKFSHRFNYQSFVRALSGVLAKKFKVKWQFKPFTRIVTWGRDFKNATKYVLQNDMEARGVIKYQPREKLRCSSA